MIILPTPSPQTIAANVEVTIKEFASNRSFSGTISGMMPSFAGRKNLVIENIKKTTK